MELLEPLILVVGLAAADIRVPPIQMAPAQTAAQAS
jgi:hypothetical protein